MILKIFTSTVKGNKNLTSRFLFAATSPEMSLRTNFHLVQTSYNPFSYLNSGTVYVVIILYHLLIFIYLLLTISCYQS